jgi:hypothetical protein
MAMHDFINIINIFIRIETDKLETNRNLVEERSNSFYEHPLGSWIPKISKKCKDLSRMRSQMKNTNRLYESDMMY